MDSLVKFFTDILGGLNGDIVIFIISLFPILELRGGLLAAPIMGVNIWRAIPICIVGNLVPIPFILIFLEKIFDLFERWSFTSKVVRWLEEKVDSKRGQIDKYGYLGLTLFVGIPLPGTGAWTGSLIAIMLGLDKKKSFICIVLGVLLAAFIMSVVSYGLLANLF